MCKCICDLFGRIFKKDIREDELKNLNDENNELRKTSLKYFKLRTDLKELRDEKEVTLSTARRLKELLREDEE